MRAKRSMATSLCRAVQIPSLLETLSDSSTDGYQRLPIRPISAPRRSALAKALGLLQGNFARDQVGRKPAAEQILEIEIDG
jgi:hypothetical protein